MLKIGKAMESIRKNSSVSVEELSKLTGYSICTIYRYEKDQYLPNLDYLVKFASLYNVTVDYILGIENRECSGSVHSSKL